jgi:hypothetical protein
MNRWYTTVPAFGTPRMFDSVGTETWDEIFCSLDTRLTTAVLNSTDHSNNVLNPTPGTINLIQT